MFTNTEQRKAINNNGTKNQLETIFKVVFQKLENLDEQVR
jgi:hypothetical protein